MSIVMRILCTWVISLLGFGNWYVYCTLCTDTANNFSVPVVRFCTDDVVSGNPVVMDGFNANGLNMKTCKCVVHISHHSTSALKLSYENAYDISPIQDVNNCSSSVVFDLENIHQRTETCKIDGFMCINHPNFVIDIYLQKDQIQSGDTRYCFKLAANNNGMMGVTCHPMDDIKASTVDIDSAVVTSVESDSTTRAIASSSIKAIDLITLDTTRRLNDETTTQRSVNETNDPKRNVTDWMQNVESDHYKSLYVAISCGTLGGIILLITVSCLIKSSRRKKLPSRKLDGNNDDNSEYGLEYNSLYVSTDINATQQSGRNHRISAITANKSQVEYSAEGNYSEINLNGKQSTEKHTKSNLGEGNYRVFIKNKGSYSEVDLDGNQENFEITSTKTIDASNSSTIKRVTSPNGSGCEYTVVEKDLKGRNDVYAVVEKTSKRNT